MSFLLSELGTFASAGFAEAIAHLELSPGDAGVLRLLARNPAMSQRDLAARIGTVPSRVVVMIDSLEDRGLVERRRKATDRRQHELHLTAGGKLMLEQLRTAAEANNNRLLTPLTAAERRELATLLAKLSAGHDLDSDIHPGYASS
jgi:DNA-binding MarR family transcriptional regulator